MRKIVLLVLLCSIFAACNKGSSLNNNSLAVIDSSAGGITSSPDTSSKAYLKPFTNITPSNLIQFNGGTGIFNDFFSTNAGLGPLFSGLACISCHGGNGRGAPILGDTILKSIIFALSIPGTDSHGGPLPAPGFGVQLQDNATTDLQAEGTIQITYQELPGNFADGEAYSLRSPQNSIINPYIALPSGLLISARIAPPNIGLGLLQAVPQQYILDLSKSEAANTNGIHGKPNMVWDESLQLTVLGRFGWKANQPSILQQTAAALNQDIGVTSSYYPVESSFGQVQAPAPHAPEISDASMDAITAFVETLAPPARRNITSAVVIRGSVLFAQAQCTSCHVPRLHTASLTGVPEATNLTIRPFTDLLLHNMGPGLADNRPDFDAKGGDWRTAPLWGIGLTQVVSQSTHNFYLHDGRARNLSEAILWHGGEAAVSATAFKAMVKTDRTALLAFLNSL